MKKTFLLLFLAFIFQFAQANPNDHGGTITGMVAEIGSNLELPGAVVRLLETNQTMVANELGVFNFTDLPGGKYTLRVSFIGFEVDTQRVTLPNHETVSVKFEMRPARLDLRDVEISERKSDPLAVINSADIKLRPVQTSQDVLRFVPGLVIAQHAGGGKAEQIFLRGFDIDHGTDIALFADGIPVNMVSHAHGQGYADLHFIIPELIQKVDFQKGTYDARTGNFATAGFVRFETQDALRENFVKLETGQFNTFRTVAALDLLGKKAAARGSSAYVAAELNYSDGYFQASQNFKRLNFFTKYRYLPDEKQSLTISASRLNSNWLASGQIPLREVEAGHLDWFGAIDSTEGGATSRTNLNVQHVYSFSRNTLIKNQLYYSKYDFELYSNFTFFLEDPVNGDEIRQREDRNLYGYKFSAEHQNHVFGKNFTAAAGLDIRYDDVADDELSRTKNRRTTLEQLAFGNVEEINAAAWSDAKIFLSDKLTFGAGLRFDQFLFSYQNRLDTTAFNSQSKSLVSPKFHLDYQILPNLRVAILSGKGFHSNDTRVVLERSADKILPAAWGHELNIYLKPTPKLLVSAGVWQLSLDQEFVYVGDAGVVEPGGKTLRRGFDVGARWQAASWLYFDADFNQTFPEALDVPESENNIPLAPLRTAIGGVSIKQNNFSASLRYRYLADRPANENNSIVAEGWSIFDATLAYFPKFKNGNQPFEFSLSAQNLGNVKWKEAQFATESRLKNEAAPVEEIHFTPGTPFWLKGGVTVKF